MTTNVGSGLGNQGVTDTLNCVLQVLFMTPEVRRIAFKGADRGRPADSIAVQLGRLFALMQLSAPGHGVRTESLTRSFGWGRAESFVAHDQQELFRVLIDAIERSAAADDARAFHELVIGRLTTWIQCRGCNAVHTISEEFCDISLDVTGVGNLMASIRRFLKPEMLEGENKFGCHSCSQKCDAVKGTNLADIPPVLAFSLRRWVFDFGTMTLTKNRDRFEFPIQIDMGQFARGEGAREVKMYDLFAVAVHVGSAQGGHNFVIIRDLGPAGQWFEFNDWTVRPIDASALADQPFVDGTILVYRSRNHTVTLQHPVVTDDEVPAGLRDFVHSFEWQTGNGNR